MAANHDLTHKNKYEIVFKENLNSVCFLDLGNRFEVFGKDALLLEKECGVYISRIAPRGQVDGVIIFTCRIPKNEATEIFEVLIKSNRKIAIARAV